MMCRGIGKQLHHRQRGHRFARAALANQRHRFAPADIEGDAVDREHLPLAGAECDGQVVDREEGCVAHRNVFRGSKASRTASPMKIKSESMMAIEKKPVRPSHGACTLALPWLNNSPSEGEPGGRPKPRKSSAVSVITEDDRMNGRKVIVATMAFGSRWRKMMVLLETPRARAAWMYSKLRPRRNSARTRPTNDTQENNNKIPSSTKKPGTSTEEIISSR